MKGQLLLRSAQRRHAWGCPSPHGLLATLNNASASVRSAQSSSMAPLVASPARQRSKLGAVDLNATFYSTQPPKHKQKSRERGDRRVHPSAGKTRGDVTQSKKQLAAGWENTQEKILARPEFPQRNDLKPEHDHTNLCKDPQSALSPALDPLAKLQNKITPLRGGTEHTIHLVWKDATQESLTATGQGPNQTLARKAAWLHLALQLHQAKQLEPLMPLRVGKVDDTQLSEEKDAMEDVYNYCARYDHLPTVERSTGTKVGGRGKGGKAYRTRIIFSELNIDVSALSTTIANADSLAAVKFKEEVEWYHAAQGTQSLVVKAGTALTTDNVAEFFKYYRTKFPGFMAFNYEEEHIGSQLFEARLMAGNDQVGPTMRHSKKKILANATRLGAAFDLIQRNPELKEGFLAALSLGNGKILTPIPVMDLPIDDTAVLLMRDTLAKARQHGLSDTFQPLEPEQQDEADFVFMQPPPSQDALERRRKYLTRARRNYKTSETMAAMRETREGLPMNAYAREVLDLVEQHQYSIIIGETGSGKTTQVPQILLDHFADAEEGSTCNIVCTQPRRIAATSVAKRVAAERGEPLKSAVGYQVRGDNQRAEQPGSINFCTTGVLLAQLQADPNALMDKLTHIVIDEVHERDKFIDYLMIILRQVISHRREAGQSVPKVVLMSATLDPSLFSPYFKNVQEGKEMIDAPVLRVPGRTFPVAEKYLEDLYSEMSEKYGMTFTNYVRKDKITNEFMQSERQFARDNAAHGDKHSAFAAEDFAQQRIIDWKKTASEGQTETTVHQHKLVPGHLVAATISHICQTTTEGAILVFLPGWEEIDIVQKQLLSENPLGAHINDAKRYKIYTLHSSMGESHGTVFEKSAPGQRKIILSTNIAETSITIPDVQYVIDTGKARELTYDQTRRLTTLACQWVSKSNAKQRAGRAGRVQNGNYYGLYTKTRYNSLRAVGLPELLRTDLQETCLDITSQKWPTPPREFLADAIEPPNPDAIDVALKGLVQIDALTPQELLTPLGRLLSSLPIHPELGKMVVLGIIFRCLDPMIILGAASSSRSLFVMGAGEIRQKVNERIATFAAKTRSDHIALLNAFNEVRAIRRSQGLAAAKTFAFDNYIHWNAFNAIEANAALIEAALMQARLIPTITAADRVSYQWGDGSLNVNSRKPHVIKALTTAGLYPRVGHKPDATSFHWRTQHEAQVKTHPASTTYVKPDRKNFERRPGPPRPLLAIFDTLSRGADDTELSMRNISYVSPLAVALFCGKLASRDTAHGLGDLSHRAASHGSKVVTVDDWLPFYLQSDDRLVVRTLLELRKALERMLVGAYADLSKRKPLTENAMRTIFSDGLVNILSLDVDTNGTSQFQAKLSDHDASEVFRRMRDTLAPDNTTTLAGRISNAGQVQDKMKKNLADDGITIGMLEWAARWEARGRAKQEKEARERGGP